MSFTTLKGRATQIRKAIGEGTSELEKDLSKLQEDLSRAFDRMDAHLTGTREAGQSSPA